MVVLIGKNDGHRLAIYFSQVVYNDEYMINISVKRLCYSLMLYKLLVERVIFQQNIFIYLNYVGLLSTIPPWWSEVWKSFVKIGISSLTHALMSM